MDTIQLTESQLMSVLTNAVRMVMEDASNSPFDEFGLGYHHHKAYEGYDEKYKRFMPFVYKLAELYHRGSGDAKLEDELAKRLPDGISPRKLIGSIKYIAGLKEKIYPCEKKYGPENIATIILNLLDAGNFNED